MSDEIRRLVDRRWARVRDLGRCRCAQRRGCVKCCGVARNCYVVDIAAADALESTGRRAGGTPRRTRAARPAPSLWPVGFAVGIACLLVGLIVSWPAVAVGAGSRRLRLPLDPRRRPRGARGARQASSRTRPRARRRRRAAGRRRRRPSERFPRSKFLEGATLGLGAVIGGVVTVPALGFAIVPAFVDQGSPTVDLGPIDNFPEGEFIDRHVHCRTRRRARSPAAPPTSATTACRQRRRASRSSPTAARTSAARCSPSGPVFDRQGEDRQDDGRRGDADPGARRRRLRLPVPRRPVRHGGQPHRRPAGPRARPLRVPDHERQPRPRSATTASARSRARARTPRSASTSSPAPASTSTARSLVSTRSSRRTDGERRRSQPTAADRGRPSSTRSTGSRSARASSAASSTSSSARSPATRTGSTRSARRR